ncbi:MAG TPA: dTDP-4-dehydrorhamnose reductase [Bacteroidales bacterium]|nr:dTDP-4-dehydrorhamnose reductase [Bacteroidales bacterium]
MKKILVTGANGQLGQSLQDISDNYPEFDFRFTDVHELDLLDVDAVKSYVADFKPSVIVNCAAYTAVDAAEKDDENALILNAGVPVLLGKTAVENGIKIIHISTDYVFDGSGNIPYRETDIASPVTVYGRTKLEGEDRLSEVLPDALILRTSWLYSPYGKNFLKTMLHLGSQKEQLNVVHDQIGSPTWAGDLAAGIMHVLLQWKNGCDWKGGLYHFSNQGVCSWYDFAWQIMQENSLDCDVRPVTSDQFPTEAKRPAYSVMSKAKFENAFDYKIPHWQEGLLACLFEM